MIGVSERGGVILGVLIRFLFFRIMFLSSMPSS